MPNITPEYLQLQTDVAKAIGTIEVANMTLNRLVKYVPNPFLSDVQELLSRVIINLSDAISLPRKEV